MPEDGWYEAQAKKAKREEDNKIHKHYVLVDGGVISYECWAATPDSILAEAVLAITQYICDHLCHQLPLKVTDEIIHRIDVRVYCLGEEGEIPIDYQKIFDEYYEEVKNTRVQNQDQEEKTFLRLLIKYEDQIPQLRKKHGGG